MKDLLSLVMLMTVTVVPWSAAAAQDGVVLTANTRVRYETIEGQARAGFDSADGLLNLRTIVGAEYRDGPVKLGAELWDSRAYGADPGTPLSTNEVNAVELVQAYIGYDVARPFGKASKMSLQAGRFLLNLGSRRLVAADDYRNTTNGYTGLRADITLRQGLSGTFIYTLPQVRLPDRRSALIGNRVGFDRESFDLVLWGGLVTKQFAARLGSLELSYYHLGERDTPRTATRDRSLETVGARFYRDAAGPGADFELEAIHQFGSVSSTTTPGASRLNVSAWFAHVEGGYTLAHGWAPRAAIEFDYASGDGRGGGFGRFDTLFGMRRADLAPSGLYNAVGRGNLLAIGARVEATPSKRVDGFLAYRPLWLASLYDAFSTTGVRDPSGASGRFAGHQLEARVRYWLVPKRLRLEWDGVALMKGRFLRDAPNAPSGRTTIYNSLNATLSL